MVKCNHCKSSENSYVMIVPRDHSEPVQIDIWHFKNTKANLIGSLSNGNFLDYSLVDHLIFCGNCHSSTQKQYEKINNDLSIKEVL